MDDPAALAVAIEVARAVEVVACVAVVLLLAGRWRTRRAPATAAALGLFAVLGFALASGYWTPPDPDSGVGLLWSKAVVCALLGLPVLLVLFTRALGGVGEATARAAVGLYGLQVVLTLAVPPLPGSGATERPAEVLAYTAAVVLVWVTLCAVAARGLWRAGDAQSSVVRHRMRSLAAGGVLLAVAAILSGAAGGDPAPAVELALLFGGSGSVLLFALAFLLPSSLRLVWRQADLAALADAERGLMTALTARDVAVTIEPVLAGVLGGSAVLLDGAGAPLRPERAAEAPVAALPAPARDGSATAAGAVTEVAPGVLVARLAAGWLVARGGRLAPVFGDDEAVLLSRVATLVDLALQRVALFEREQASRLAAEAASAELESLLYSVSHDLRSPLISMLGYLSLLRAEHGDALGGEGLRYLERITVNAVYMQSLIADLLELSRIGRSDPPADVVDLAAVAGQVAEGARLARPTADVRLAGGLPRVRMSDVRARQLLTNLVDNAHTHAGRDDVAVTVSARRGDSGELVLEVADDGCGVPEQDRARVLRVFERLDAPKSSSGTGIGLAICKRIAESLGGSFEIGGAPPGAASGATARITLPAAVLVDEPTAGALLPAPREPGARPASPSGSPAPVRKGHA
jgi:signal transduction histidine kinase